MVPFHLAFPISDLAATRQFYESTLGCSVGRTSDRWIDFDFFGHQLSAHLTDERPADPMTNPVDGKAVPVRHFGAILNMKDWKRLAERLKKAGIDFVIEPYVRFEGEPGEQATMFFLDPSGNALEFKAFPDPSKIFATS
jgi:extradiol dioxygenase family protein